MSIARLDQLTVTVMQLGCWAPDDTIKYHVNGFGLSVGVGDVLKVARRVRRRRQRSSRRASAPEPVSHCQGDRVTGHRRGAVGLDA